MTLSTVMTPLMKLAAGVSGPKHEYQFSNNVVVIVVVSVVVVVVAMVSY